MPASTRILVVELETIAQCPPLPEASMDTPTPMFASILVNPVDSVVTFWLAGDLRARAKAKSKERRATNDERRTTNDERPSAAAKRGGCGVSRLAVVNSG